MRALGVFALCSLSSYTHFSPLSHLPSIGAGLLNVCLLLTVKRNPYLSSIHMVEMDTKKVTIS